MTYATLKADIATYMHRTDLTALLGTFIQRAEAYLFRELQAKELQLSVTGTTAAGGYIALPSDFGSVSRLTVTSNGASFTLDYLAVANAPTSTSSVPSYYSLETDQLRIYGASDGQAYTLTYIPKFQALSDSNTTNWLLDNAQDLYLYAGALELARHIRNDSEINKLMGIMPTLIDSVKRYAERRGQPATGSLQIKPRRGQFSSSGLGNV